MTRQELKDRCCKAIDARADGLIADARALRDMPEPGYREHKTSAYVKARLEQAGLRVQDGLGLTGLKARAPGGKSLFNVALVGELDSLLLPGHPHADPVTGAAHACGHYTSLVCMLGALFGLLDSGVLSELDGDVSFIAAPAEEIIEFSYRDALRQSGKIAYFGGKQELIRLGALDDVDVAVCSHISHHGTPFYRCGNRSNGVLNKQARFIGRAAHAAGSPELGVNALHAAVSAINNINALRDRFRDDDHVRVHYIVTKGGDTPNIVPDDVRLEMGVRASSTERMLEAAALVDQALRSGAEAIGAKVEITNLGAYLPMHQHQGLSRLFLENAAALIGQQNVLDTAAVVSTGSTDAGDLAAFRPTIHPYFGGSKGALHTVDVVVTNERFVYVDACKAYACTVIDLLAGQAAACRKIVDSYQPEFATKEDYCAFCDKLYGVQ